MLYGIYVYIGRLCIPIQYTDIFYVYVYMNDLIQTTQEKQPPLPTLSNFPLQLF